MAATYNGGYYGRSCGITFVPFIDLDWSRNLWLHNTNKKQQDNGAEESSGGSTMELVGRVANQQLPLQNGECQPVEQSTVHQAPRIVVHPWNTRTCVRRREIGRQRCFFHRRRLVPRCHYRYYVHVFALLPADAATTRRMRNEPRPPASVRKRRLQVLELLRQTLSPWGSPFVGPGWIIHVRWSNKAAIGVWYELQSVALVWEGR